MQISLKKILKSQKQSMKFALIFNQQPQLDKKQQIKKILKKENRFVQSTSQQACFILLNYNQQNSRMGAICMTGSGGSRKKSCDCPQCAKCERQFLADIRTLHKNYVPLVLHVRETRLFQSRNQKLVKAVQKYFDENFKVEGLGTDVACVDMVRKLHPREYWFEQIDQEWLIQACLRQQKFADETKVEKVTFDHAYPEYLEFLTLCNVNMKNKKITVPSKCQDIIWHSHMMDPQNYKKDVEAYLGQLLNHSDDIPDEDLKRYAQQTNKLAAEIRQGQKAGNP